MSIFEKKIQLNDKFVQEKLKDKHYILTKWRFRYNQMIVWDAAARMVVD
jgi:hypothetical protein